MLSQCAGRAMEAAGIAPQEVGTFRLAETCVQAVHTLHGRCEHGKCGGCSDQAGIISAGIIKAVLSFV